MPMNRDYAEDARLFRSAAEYLRENGWHQGSFFSLQGHQGKFKPACALGAILASCDVNVLGMDLQGFMRYYEDYALPYTQHTRLALWNDAKERTADEVITLLETVAEAIETNYVAKPAAAPKASLELALEEVPAGVTG